LGHNPGRCIGAHISLCYIKMKIQLTKLDKLWAQAVKLRDKNTCRRCGRQGKPRGMHAAHIEGRAKKNTRWLLDNGLTLCFLCHRWFDEHKGIRDAWLAEAGIMTEKERDALRLSANMTWDKDLFKWQVYLDQC